MVCFLSRQNNNFSILQHKKNKAEEIYEDEKRDFIYLKQTESGREKIGTKDSTQQIG